MIIEEVKDKVKELRDNNIPVYSISRLNAVDSCAYEYYQTYIKKQKSIDNIYGLTGSHMHQIIEDICNGNKADPKEELEVILNDCEMLDIHFPNEKIKDKWCANMRDFVAKFSKPEWFDNAESEVQFLFEIDGEYLQGFIDIIEFLDDNYINILDWKTSSKFAKKDLIEKGRQLIVYGMAMEQLGFKINSVGWRMLKYCVVSWKLKNGSTKEKVCERGFWIKECENDICKELSSLGYSDLDIEILIENAKNTNDITLLPKEIQDKYKIVDYTQYYDYTEENKKECKKYIKEKIKQIKENMDNDLFWLPKEINYGSEFYCSNLCGHRNNCEYLKKYHDEQDALRQSYSVAKNNDNFDDLLE